MNIDVCIIEVNSSGSKGFPDDEVVEIGICGADLKKADVETLYSSFIRYDTDSWNAEKKEHLKNSGISLKDISNGTDLDVVCKDVKKILGGRSATSYDIRDVFHRYMVNEPWDLTKEVTVMPSVCSRLPLPRAGGNERIVSSYNSMFRDDPMNVKNGRSALDFALMTSAILVELRKKGRY